MRHPSLAALAAGLFSLATPAQNLTSDQVMRIHFTVPVPHNLTPDVLKLNFGMLTVHQAFGTRTAELWDCGQLLGTAASSSFGNHVGALNLDPSNSWKAVGSLWTFDNPGVVQNFTPITSGSITGIIHFSIASGAVTIPLAQVNLNMIQATSGSGGRVVSPSPVVTDIVIGPKLTGPTPGTAGTTNTYTTTGGIPNGVMWFGFGVACSPFPIPCSPPAIFDILPPLVFAPAPTDPGGVANLSLPVTPTVAGVTIMTQAIELAGASCNVSNHVVHTFQ